ncbi:MAG: TetR/AcrR family transcriptional regulator [Nocardia sp.]|uniref:hypothetical protein n=1 Tax=Nocardia sp. TaxID=1821 RepID=UPI0026326EA1|nr:hypothetical protein [Nocardia sp.]MCU1639834.1 TetR/AcrR family transcriptional regulator [Nocardia sp.]
MRATSIADAIAVFATVHRVFAVAIAIVEGTIEEAYRNAPRNEWIVSQGRMILQLYLEAHCG